MSGDTAVRNGILQGLEDLGSEYSMYTTQNIAVTGTHQHSGPGAVSIVVQLSISITNCLKVGQLFTATSHEPGLRQTILPGHC